MKGGHNAENLERLDDFHRYLRFGKNPNAVTVQKLASAEMVRIFGAVDVDAVCCTSGWCFSRFWICLCVTNALRFSITSKRRPLEAILSQYAWSCFSDTTARLGLKVATLSSPLICITQQPAVVPPKEKKKKASLREERMSTWGKPEMR